MKTTQKIVGVYVVTGFIESGKTTLIHSMLEDKGFVNAQGDKITETGTSKSTMMVSPSGFSISVSEHIRKED